MRKLTAPLVGLLLSSAVLAQNVHDHYTAGYDNARSSLAVNAGHFQSPFEMFETIDLTGIASADTMIVFENFVLVGEGGPTAHYHLYDLDTGELEWDQAFGGSSMDLNYVPAYANDVVLLGSSTTTTVRGVHVPTGATLWEDSTIGSAVGRHPIVTDDLALYHGQGKLVARMASTGAVIWQVETSTAEAEIALFGRTLYLVQAGGTVQARNVFDGSLFWSSIAGAAGNGSSVVATENFAFISNNAGGGFFGALEAHTGAGVWAQAGSTFGFPALAQGYDLLFAFLQNDDGMAEVRAVDPETGAMVWEYVDPVRPPGIGIPPSSGTAMFGQIANNQVYFYNTSSGRIRVLDAFSGTLLWSIDRPDVRALSIREEKLYVLLADSVEVYEPLDQIYFAQIADGMDAVGQSQSTLLTLNNLTDEIVTGTVDYLESDGDPMLVVVAGAGAAPISSRAFVIQPRSSVKIQTLGVGALQAGWARVTADGYITGSSIFQAGEAGDIFFEAGVAAARATGMANVFVNRTGTALDPGRQFSTGVAIANPSDESARVTIRLLDNATGAELASVVIILPPDAHIARFIEEAEFFPANAVLGFEGTIVIESDIPVVVTALRTQGGFQMSSYPVGQVVR